MRTLKCRVFGISDRVGAGHDNNGIIKFSPYYYVAEIHSKPIPNGEFFIQSSGRLLRKRVTAQEHIDLGGNNHWRQVDYFTDGRSYVVAGYRIIASNDSLIENGLYLPPKLIEEIHKANAPYSIEFIYESDSTIPSKWKHNLKIYDY